jgi:hypothetical protein
MSRPTNAIIARVMRALRGSTVDRTTDLTRDLAASDSQMYSGLRLDRIAAVREIIHSEEGLQSSVGVQKYIHYCWNLYRLTLFTPCPILDARQLVDTMKKILLATVAILAFATPSFAAEPDKTVGQAPPSGASSFYLAQDTATMKCQVVNTQPAAGANMKVIGTTHPTQASAQTALTAEKTCIK